MRDRASGWRVMATSWVATASSASVSALLEAGGLDGDVGSTRHPPTRPPCVCIGHRLSLHPVTVATLPCAAHTW